jgi:hypothetical protein
LKFVLIWNLLKEQNWTKDDNSGLNIHFQLNVGHAIFVL